jgi:hypothetical protein
MSLTTEDVVVRNFMALIFRMYEAGKPDQLIKTTCTRTIGFGLRCPVDSRLTDNIGITPGCSEMFKAAQINLDGIEFKSYSPTNE